MKIISVLSEDNTKSGSVQLINIHTSEAETSEAETSEDESNSSTEEEEQATTSDEEALEAQQMRAMEFIG